MASSKPDELRPDYAESIKFLQKWNPQGPWILTAIDPNKKGIETASFAAAEHEACRLWLQDQGDNKKRNLYFTVNAVTRMIDTKPSREHIAGMTWLHVDLDPRAGEDIAEEQKRILNLLRNPPAPIPPPTAIIFSGGGYQGFWKLERPVLLDGTPEQYEEAKRYNKQLEIVLGGDNCHNVDRIMRVPGSINRPDARKRKKGRRGARADMVEWNGVEYKIEKFTKAPMVRSEAPGFSGGTVQISGNVARFSSVDEIKELKDSPQARVVIVQGDDPDDPDKFGQSRSEWLFFVCCEMVRAGCSDDDIYSVITDPDFGISVSVLDKGSGIEGYAIRQIERAREHAIDPMLTEMNDKHAVIGSIGSKGLCRILSEERDAALGRSRIAYQNQSDFLLRYRNKMVDFVASANGKMASKPAGIWWLDHPQRRYYDTVVFAPGIDTPGSYNLWKGFGCDAIKGEIPRFESLVNDVIANGNSEVADYLWRFMAWAIQNPGDPAGVAVALRGGQGTGKGTFVNAFGHLFGRHYLTVTGAGLITGQFNAHLRECVVMFADEQKATDDPKVEARLKVLITEPRIMTEAKGVDAEMTKNCLHIFLASNSDWIVPVDDDDRRYVVFDVSDERKQDGAYFGPIEEELESGGYEALFDRLLSTDLGNWHPRQDRPRTEAHAGQKRESLKGIAAVWHDVLVAGELPHLARHADDGTGRLFLPSKLLADHVTASERWRSKKPCTVHALGRFFGKMGFEKIRPGTEPRSKGYALPPLPQARAAWDDAMWADPEWDLDDDEWVIDHDGPAHETFGP